MGRKWSLGGREQGFGEVGDAVEGCGDLGGVGGVGGVLEILFHYTCRRDLRIYILETF